jgi:hypothetical protein
MKSIRAALNLGLLIGPASVLGSARSACKFTSACRSSGRSTRELVEAKAGEVGGRYEVEDERPEMEEPRPGRRSTIPKMSVRYQVKDAAGLVIDRRRTWVRSPAGGPSS